jgi:hypothetical protein
LQGSPVTILFLRLPDGIDGEGSSTHGYESLQELFQGTISSRTAVDSSTTYAYQDLINTLTALMSLFGPQLIATQDFIGQFGDGDHSDHYATAYFTALAQVAYGPAHQLVGYEGYGIENLPVNLSGASWRRSSRPSTCTGRTTT